MRSINGRQDDIVDAEIVEDDTVMDGQPVPMQLQGWRGKVALILLGVFAGMLLVAGWSSADDQTSEGMCVRLATEKTVCAPLTSPKGGTVVSIDKRGVAHYDNGGEYVQGQGFRPGR